MFPLKTKLFVLLLSIGVGVFLIGNVREYFRTWDGIYFGASPGHSLFKQRVNRSVDLFLSAKCKLSKHAFDWWKQLQPEKRDYIYYQKTVDNLAKVFPSVSNGVEPCLDHCRTCAVVGNSVNLKGSLYGSVIDANDVVFSPPTWFFQGDLHVEFSGLMHTYPGHGGIHSQWKSSSLVPSRSCRPGMFPSKARFSLAYRKTYGSILEFGRLMHNYPERGQRALTIEKDLVLNSRTFEGMRLDTVVLEEKPRMNRSPTKGYEKDVGTKTTHRIMYPESAVDLDNATRFILLPFKIMDLEWLQQAFTTGFFGKSYAPVKSTIRANEDLVMVVSPVFMMYVHHVWLESERGYPSTGFMALILALHICDEVRVFGFGGDKHGSWTHYWEKPKDKNFKTGLHPGNLEYYILEQLAKEQALQLFNGSRS